MTVSSNSVGGKLLKNEMILYLRFLMVGKRIELLG
jgi:hypothetical protein